MTKYADRTVYNINIPSANVEYSQALSIGTKKFKAYALTSAKTYVHRGALKLGFTSGSTFSAGNHIPLPPGGIHEESGLLLSEHDRTVYFQTNTGAPAYVILIEWR